VTLSGAVSSPESRTQAVALARQTEGVKNVVDKLTIAAPQPGPPPGPPEGAVAANDEAITSAVRLKLASKPAVAAAVVVDTRSGVVTLSGTVPTQNEKQEIIQIARDTQGVQKVEDHLTVRSS
jgi:osmotically-inducible protein OsmY